uniref:Calponin-homology (CH) domain-containing protein n=1 Tax=Calidris pygmaea TaxID=425635 RepID=A0A8C3KBV2_9CHAR
PVPPPQDPHDTPKSSCHPERDRVQKKTFTKWVNKHLIKRHVNDLYEDLRDGHNLISLLEVLSGDTLPREKGRMRFHKLQNVQIALNYLKHRQVMAGGVRGLLGTPGGGGGSGGCWGPPGVEAGSGGCWGPPGFGGWIMGLLGTPGSWGGCRRATGDPQGWGGGGVGHGAARDPQGVSPPVPDTPRSPR